MLTAFATIVAAMIVLIAILPPYKKTSRDFKWLTLLAIAWLIAAALHYRGVI